MQHEDHQAQATSASTDNSQIEENESMNVDIDWDEDFDLPENDRHFDSDLSGPATPNQTEPINPADIASDPGADNTQGL